MISSQKRYSPRNGFYEGGSDITKETTFLAMKKRNKDCIHIVGFDSFQSIFSHKMEKQRVGHLVVDITFPISLDFIEFNYCPLCGKRKYQL